MRILQLVTTRQRRGAEVFAAQLSEGLADAGHDVALVGLQREQTYEALAPRGVLCTTLHGSRDLRFDPILLGRVVRELRRFGPDVVQANGGVALKYSVLAQRLSRSSIPILYRNIGVSSDWLTLPGQRWWIRWLLGGVKLVASVAEASRDDLIATYGISPEKVLVVGRGVPIGAIRDGRSLRAELGIAAEAPLLVHVGRRSPEKNHEGLVRIFRKIRKSVPQAALALVGCSVDEIAPEPNVYALGVRDDVSQILAASEILLLPSLTEGVPGVILEAAVQSVPAVAYQVGGVAEAVVDGKTGRLVSAGSEELFASRVLELIRDPGARTAMGEAARAKVVRERSLGASVRTFERLYESLTS